MDRWIEATDRVKNKNKKTIITTTNRETSSLFFILWPEAKAWQLETKGWQTPPLATHTHSPCGSSKLEAWPWLYPKLRAYQHLAQGARSHHVAKDNLNFWSSYLYLQNPVLFLCLNWAALNRERGSPSNSSPQTTLSERLPCWCAVHVCTSIQGVCMWCVCVSSRPFNKSFN